MRYRREVRTNDVASYVLQEEIVGIQCQWDLQLIKVFKNCLCRISRTLLGSCQYCYNKTLSRCFLHVFRWFLKPAGRESYVLVHILSKCEAEPAVFRCVEYFLNTHRSYLSTSNSPQQLNSCYQKEQDIRFGRSGQQILHAGRYRL